MNITAKFCDQMTDSTGPTTLQLRRAFGDKGLNLFATARLVDLPAELRETLCDLLGEPGLQQGVVGVVGHKGSAIWTELAETIGEHEHPVDDYSFRMTTEILGRALAGGRYRILFPFGPVIPLQKIGNAVGLGESSWLGINIHPQFGTWYAFRAVFVTDVPLRPFGYSASAGTCGNCIGRPCVDACPVSAPNAPPGFDLDACMQYRLKPDSPCATKCLARNECPVARDLRYPESMTHYFYSRSLDTLRKYHQQRQTGESAL